MLINIFLQMSVAGMPSDFPFPSNLPEVEIDKTSPDLSVFLGTSAPRHFPQTSIFTYSVTWVDFNTPRL